MSIAVQTPADSAKSSNSAVWAGRVLSGLAFAFLTFDVVGKLLQVQPVIQSTVELGYPASAVLTIGVVEALCLALYTLGRTSMLGAVMLTGYLGGAVATHVRVDSPLLSHTLFPIYVGIFLWGGLLLRDAPMRAFVVGRVAR